MFPHGLLPSSESQFCMKAINVKCAGGDLVLKDLALFALKIYSRGGHTCRNKEPETIGAIIDIAALQILSMNSRIFHPQIDAFSVQLEGVDFFVETIVYKAQNWSFTFPPVPKPNVALC